MRLCVCLVLALALFAGCQEPQSDKPGEPTCPMAEKKCTKAPAPEKVAVIVMDDSGAEFKTEGSWESAWTGKDHKGGLQWAFGSATATAKAIWTPEIKVAGTYKVYEWHGADPNDDHATDAPFTICCKGGSKTVPVNLRENIGKWNLLGAFKFAAGGTSGRIMLTNKANGNVVADGIKLVYKCK